MACRFTELVIDCHDHDRLGRFWAEVLGYREVERSDGPDEWYVELEGPPGAGPKVLLLRAPDEEVERILALGATRIDIGQGEQSWVVLSDPEGNEFCVLRSTVDPLPPAQR